jgi:protein-disulfide isomerase
MVLRESEFDKIILQLEKRYASFVNPQEFIITPTILAPAGDRNAKITITAYISANCSLCKKVVIPLNMAVTKGPIEKKAILYLKPILPDISNMALIAAQKMGKFWEYYFSLEKEKRRLNEKILLLKAKKLKLPLKEFKKMLYDEEIKKILQENKSEAIRNGVEITPTLFINNRRYSSYKNPQWIIDLVEYEYEKVK